jgi:hypothetical protein
MNIKKHTNPETGLIEYQAIGSAIKGLENNRVSGYLVRFTDNTDPDLHGEYFDKRTNFWLQEHPLIGKPIMIDHAFDPKFKSVPVGIIDFSAPRLSASASHACPSSAQIEFSGLDGHMRASWIRTAAAAITQQTRTRLGVSRGGGDGTGNRLWSSHARVRLSAAWAVIGVQRSGERCDPGAVRNAAPRGSR